MKKVFLLATAVLLFGGVTFADGGKKKKCAKGKTCCHHTGKCCSKDKEKTANL